MPGPNGHSLVYILNKTRSYNTVQIGRRNHEDIFGDVRMFFMSVVRHSPVFEHTATLVFETFGEARIEKLLYAFTLRSYDGLLFFVVRFSVSFSHAVIGG